MITLPSLNLRHKIGLVLTLAATGTSLLLDVSAKQTSGIMLLGLAGSWFVGSVAVRTLGIVLSVITFWVGLCVAVLPIWKERESSLAMAREYDATVAEIRWAAERNEEYERIQKLFGPSVPLKRADHLTESPIPPGASLAEPMEYKGTVDIPYKWVRHPHPEELTPKYDGSIAVSLGSKASAKEVMRVFQTEVLLPRPAFSLNASVARHRVASFGGGSLSLLGLLSCILLVLRARKAKHEATASNV